jgi:hypothetical protein
MRDTPINHIARGRFLYEVAEVFASFVVFANVPTRHRLALAVGKIPNRHVEAIDRVFVPRRKRSHAIDSLVAVVGWMRGQPCNLMRLPRGCAFS